jgi:hypothetical protein
MTSTAGSGSAVEQRAQLILVVSMAVTAVLYIVPYGRLVARPLVLLSTVAHELGHGLAAILVGGRFQALLIWSDGSGVATWSALVGRLGYAAIAAGGLVGPALAASALFVLGRTVAGARVCALVLGAGLVLAEILVVRTAFGLLFVGLVAVVLLAVGLWAPDWLAQGSLVFIAVQLALSVFSRADYLFTRVATTAEGTRPSDSALIAEALVLPFWFWGAICGLLSIAALLAGLVVYLRPAAVSRSVTTRL